MDSAVVEFLEKLVSCEIIQSPILTRYLLRSSCRTLLDISRLANVCESCCVFLKKSEEVWEVVLEQIELPEMDLPGFVSSCCAQGCLITLKVVLQLKFQKCVTKQEKLHFLNSLLAALTKLNKRENQEEHLFDFFETYFQLQRDVLPPPFIESTEELAKRSISESSESP